jgi:hypothetical protein
VPARVTRVPGALAAQSSRTVHMCDGAVARSPVASWRLAGGKVYPGSTSGAPGWRRARKGPVGLTEDVGRWRGGASGFRWRHSMVVGKLRGSAVMKVWPYSSEEEGRGEAAP